MADTTITSANSVLTFTASLFPVPVQMKGYSADTGFMSEAVDLAQVQMGIDGRMTSGYTPNPVPVTITLQADSPSLQFVDLLSQGMKTAREVIYVTGTLTLPSTGKSYTMTRGVLTNYKPFPDGAKVLQPVPFTLTFESVNQSVI